jgi:nucleotide-binding universal stress UspA family protein
MNGRGPFLGVTMKILIAYDGSDCSDAALDDLRYAGLPQAAEVLVLSAGEINSQSPTLAALAVGSGYYFPDDSQVEALNDQQRDESGKLSARAVDRLGAAFPKWHVESEGIVDMAESAIVGKAASWKPDLLVVGSHGRSGFRRFFLGSVSLYVLNHTRCSVRIGRRYPHAHNGPIRILVGADRSPDAAAALRAVAARHWPKGTEARVVSVLDSRSILLESGAEVSEPMIAPVVVNELRNRVSETIQRAAQKLADSGLLAEAQVLEGNPGLVLVAEAEQWDADCIFVGAGGLNAFERFFHGSVCTTVGERAHCSVEVVREPA